MDALAQLLLEAHRDAATQRALDALSDAQRAVLNTRCAPLRVFAGALGGAFGARSVQLMTAWAASRLRPDLQPVSAPISTDFWLYHTSWRPALAVLAQFGFASLPRFPNRYHQRDGDSVIDALCGIWSIGESTCYRYFEKGKQQFAAVFDNTLEPEQIEALRLFARAELFNEFGLHDLEAQRVWHAQLAASAEADGQVAEALWHLRLAGDILAATALVQRHLNTLAGSNAIDAELTRLRSCAAAPGTPSTHAIALLLTEAAVWRVRRNPQRELAAYERALRAASDAQDSAALGSVYAHLGQYYELRDPERAYACFQESVTHFDAATSAGRPDSLHVQTIVRLAWLQAERKHPQARALLDRAEALRQAEPISDATLALLEQAWGEYLRRTDAPREALARTHRALNIYERLNDQEGVIKTQLNLGLVHMHLQEHMRALACFDYVLSAAERVPVDSRQLARTFINIGACHFFLGAYAAAIAAYERAREISEQNELAQCLHEAHYNLAEAHYSRFVQRADPADELAGDRHLQRALLTLAPGSPADVRTELERLKPAILAGHKEYSEYRLLEPEEARHHVELERIRSQRLLIDQSNDPLTQLRAHLVIAEAYLSISAAEREQALRLAERHGLHSEISAGVRHLTGAFQESLSERERVAQRWHAQAAFIDEAQRIAVVDALFTAGAINKSAYAGVCGVSLATASKHLGQLTELGLLRQEGRGPATKYVLAIDH